MTTYKAQVRRSWSFKGISCTLYTASAPGRALEMIALPLGIALYTCVVELPLLMFHVSVAAFVASQYLSRNKNFMSGFYAIYIVQSFMDVGNVVTVGFPTETLMGLDV